MTLLLGCATPANTRHHPILSRAEAVQIARRCASRHKVAFRNYFEPETNFETSNDYEWGVYFFRRPERNPNKGFLVCVDDRTKKTSFYFLSALPTE
jgi:hypothetical protein